MKGNKFLLYPLLTIVCMLLMTSTVLIYAVRPDEYISELAFEEANVIASVSTENDIVSTMNTKKFVEKEVYNSGLKIIENISTEIPEFYYWKESEIVNFQFLHSFKTGYATYALFEILGGDGNYGHLIYDCEKQEPSSFASGKSPFALVDTALLRKTNVDLTALITCKKTYYFYTGMSYGYGVLDNEGNLDIYNIRSILVEDSEIEVLSDVSFNTEETMEAETKEMRIVGDADAVAAFQERMAEAEAQLNGSRTVLYPSRFLLDGVPDYLQENTGRKCIPLSMSNIIGYWDVNGFPNLVPTSYHTDREEYISSNIDTCLNAQTGGNTANVDHSPAIRQK